MEFECANNIVEYEALVLGLKKAIDLKVEFLKVIGDSKVVTREVLDTIHCVSPNLKNYQQEVWHLINYFKAFNIIYVPTLRIVTTNALSNATTRMSSLRNVSLFRL